MNENVIKDIERIIDQTELGVSSYWDDYFKEYNYKNGKYFVRQFLKVKVGERKTILHDIGRNILQTPFFLFSL